MLFIIVVLMLSSCHSGFLIHGDYISAEDALVLYLMSLFHPKIMIMGESYPPSAKFIKLLKGELPEIWFINVSFVGNYSLKCVLGEISKESNIDGIKSLRELGNAQSLANTV